MNRLMMLLLMLVSLLESYEAQAFYNPSTGKWLSRDPIGDVGAPYTQTDRRPLNARRLANPYWFVANNPILNSDYLGLEILPWGDDSGPPWPRPQSGESVGDGSDISWSPSVSSCGPGTSSGFIQVGYGGSWPYKEPFVDDGSRGFGLLSGTGCPEYPSLGHPGNFEDSPKGLTGPVKFIICQVCVEPCCSAAGPGRHIVNIVTCKKWKRGDIGSLGMPAFSEATSSEVLTIWRATVAKKYPDWMKCYRCKR